MKTVFPFEVLKMQPAQRFTRKLNAEQTADMIKHTAMLPQKRRETINNALKTPNILDYVNNDYMKEFGLHVEPEMMTVPARILPAPQVQLRQGGFGGGGRGGGGGGRGGSRPGSAPPRMINVPGQDGYWNMNKGKIIDPIPLSCFAFVFFVKMDNDFASDLRDQFIQKWRNAGMDIRMENPPIVIANPAIQGRMEWAIQQAGNEAFKATKLAPQIIVTVMDGQKGLYEQVKVFTLVHKAVLTQCLQFRHFKRGEIKDQYATNVALKVSFAGTLVCGPLFSSSQSAPNRSTSN